LETSGPHNRHAIWLRHFRAIDHRMETGESKADSCPARHHDRLEEYLWATLKEYDADLSADRRRHILATY